jgi:glutathione S-transferase
MTDREPLRFKGAPGSPYTRKMLAVLRYRHLPYEFLIGHQADAAELPRPRVPLLPTFYLPNASGELEAVVDSTPLIRRFEAEFPGRGVLPPDPVMNFLDFLLEDYADEWLTRAMFHYRWSFRADIDKSARILPLWRDLTMSDADHAEAERMFAERQISRLHVVGSSEVTAPVIEASYERFLTVMETLLAGQPFLLGDRPGSADFGVYAQLTQLAKFDPTPMALCLERAPRTFAWVDVMDDLSGLPDDDAAWLPRDRARAVLGGLLMEVGRVHAPSLLANARALEAGESDWETTIDGRRWTQPVFPYQGKCLAWLRECFAELAPDDASAVRTILADTGCEAMFEGR